MKVLSSSPPIERPEGMKTRQNPGVDRSRLPPEMVQAAEGMEAMFLDYMLKVMREANPKNEGGLDNAATEIYRGMLDSEISQKAARVGGVGLADQILAYMQRQSGYNNSQGPGPARTGGTDEDQSVRRK